MYVDDCWVGAITMISSAGGGTFSMAEILTGKVDWNAAAGSGNNLA
jgi:hypothetical protein